MKIFFVIALFVFSFSLGKTQVYDSINFENYYPISEYWVIQIDSMDGIWQIGEPSKQIFSSALSSPNSLITDTVNNYSINQDSYFYFHIDVLNSESINQQNSVAKLSFDFKLDTDTINDYGQIEFLDNSQWIPLASHNDFTYWGMNLQDSDYSPQWSWDSIPFSGSFNNWTSFTITVWCWGGIFSPDEQNRGFSDYLNFRFHFHSDSIFDNKEGWLIDNITWENFTGYCIGDIFESQNQIQLSVYPTLTDNKITFETESEKFSQISIYDFSGKLVETFNFQPSNFKTLQLSNYVNGMYFYSVDNGKANGKFIVEN